MKTVFIKYWEGNQPPNVGGVAVQDMTRHWGKFSRVLGPYKQAGIYLGNSVVLLGGTFPRAKDWPTTDER